MFSHVEFSYISSRTVSRSEEANVVTESSIFTVAVRRPSYESSVSVFLSASSSERAAMIHQFKAGESRCDISRVLDIPEQTVSDTIRVFRGSKPKVSRSSAWLPFKEHGLGPVTPRLDEDHSCRFQ